MLRFSQASVRITSGPTIAVVHPLVIHQLEIGQPIKQVSKTFRGTPRFMERSGGGVPKIRKRGPWAGPIDRCLGTMRTTTITATTATKFLFSIRLSKNSRMITEWTLRDGPRVRAVVAGFTGIDRPNADISKRVVWPVDGRVMLSSRRPRRWRNCLGRRKLLAGHFWSEAGFNIRS